MNKTWKSVHFLVLHHICSILHNLTCLHILFILWYIIHRFDDPGNRTSFMKWNALTNVKLVHQQFRKKIKWAYFCSNMLKLKAQIFFDWEISECHNFSPRWWDFLLILFQPDITYSSKADLSLPHVFW